MRGGFALGLIAAFGLGVHTAAHAGANPLTRAEQSVCRTPQHCFDILSRHDATQFDYTVLGEGFLRFGGRGKGALMRGLTHKDKDVATRAAAVLTDKRFALDKREQNRIAMIWTKRPTPDLLRLMRVQYSPVFREAFIKTLNHSDASIREWSRRGLLFGEHQSNPEGARTAFQPNPGLYPDLARASVNDPTSEVVKFIASYPKARSQPILRRALRNAEAEIVGTAYQGLYNIDAETAFKTLIATLRGLKPGDEAIGLAIGEVLESRNKARKDGFYLSFAKDIAADKAMPNVARMAGVHAIMSQTHLKADRVQTLPETQDIQTILFMATHAMNTVPRRYSDKLLLKLGPAHQSVIPKLYTAFKETGDQNKFFFVDALGEKYDKSPLSKEVEKALLRALDDTTDWRVVSSAADILGKNKVTAARPALTALGRNHLFTRLRFSGLTALDKINGKNTVKQRLYWKNTLSKSTISCPVEARDFKALARPLPFFEDTKIANGYKSARPFLTSAVATKAGWLAGYDFGEFSGGLVAYDNKTGQGDLIIGNSKGHFEVDPNSTPLSPNIMAVLPQRVLPLGQYADQFWAISRNVMMSESYIFKITDTGDGYKAVPLRRLPRLPQAITQEEDGSVILGFGKKTPPSKNDYEPLYQPPLRLSPNGTLSLACDAFSKSTIEAMP